MSQIGLLNLLDLPPDRIATVVQLQPVPGVAVEPNVLTRLGELGFLPGESITLLRRGPGGREPIAVHIGDTVFALRAVEAGCVQVRLQP